MILEMGRSHEKKPKKKKKQRLLESYKYMLKAECFCSEMKILLHLIFSTFIDIVYNKKQSQITAGVLHTIYLMQT